MKEYHSNMFRDFGLTIVDEVHHISSEVFSRSLQTIVTKYSLGLSATMQRKDGLTKVFKMFLLNDREFIDRLINGAVLPPREVDLHWSWRCQLKCRWCYARQADYRDAPGRYLSEEKAYSVLDELKELGVKVVTFSGGGRLVSTVTLSGEEDEIASVCSSSNFSISSLSGSS